MLLLATIVFCLPILYLHERIQGLVLYKKLCLLVRSLTWDSEMDLKSSKQFRRLCLACLLASTVGCVAPAVPVPTVWQKLGIPQTGARLRDGILNRQGNFPGLERKPPVLKIADPANLDPSKPDMLKAAAKIKQEQDLKKQKIKALKYLAEINCGCYNKDGAVEAAFLEALEDCDPDIRTAAIEGLSKAAGNCKCRSGCETTCCTKKIYEKLQDIATGMKDGCYKEPVPEIRKAAQALYCKCPPPPGEPIVPEELIAPDADPEKKPPKPLQEGKRNEGGDETEEDSAEAVDAKQVSYKLSDSGYGDYDTKPVVVGVAHRKPTTKDTKSDSPIANPEQLVQSKVVAYRKSLGELLVHLPAAFEMNTGWGVVIVDSKGNHSMATITEVGGLRLLLSVDNPEKLDCTDGSSIRLGLVSKK